jgi:hypothetical protein
MKKTILIAMLFSLTLTAIAQRENDYNNKGEIKTLFGQQGHSNGGYGAFGVAYSMIDDVDAIVISGRGAWIVNHTLALGIAGGGFLNDYRYSTLYQEDVNLTGGYGGLLIEPIIFPKSPVHLSVPIVAGVGGIAFTRAAYKNDPWEYEDYWVEDTDAFLVFEPGVEIELNLLRFFRLAFGVSYRMTSKINLVETPSDVMNGI